MTPFVNPRSTNEKATKDGKIQKLLRKQVIEEVVNDINTGYFYNLFTNRKKDGTYRTILNLKKKSMNTALQNILKWNQ